MLASLAADIVVLVHFAFIVFVVAGGLFVMRWPRAAWIHLPAAAWGAAIVLFGGVCPLTPLELALRRAGCEAGYDTGFIEHYLLPVIYPAGMTRDVQIVLGLIVVGVNLCIYAIALVRRRRVRRLRSP